jgi:hypothetical protein
MGFNVEEYEMYDNDTYSNALGFGCELIIKKDKKRECEAARDARISEGKLIGKIQNVTQNVKTTLKIGDGKILGKVISKDKNAQYNAKAQAIASAKAQADADYKAQLNQIQADAIAQQQALDVVQEAELKAQLKADADATKMAIDEQAKIGDFKAEQKPLSGSFSSGTTDTTKSNTGMYIGIGIGVLAIGIVAIVLIKKK